MGPYRVAVSFMMNDFALFIKSESYSSYQEALDRRLCLLDVVWLWLEYGSGYIICQTFESLLLFVIAAADDFVKSDMSGLWGLDLRPTRLDESAFIEGIMTSVHEPQLLDQRTHPVLDRHEFEHGLGRQLRLAQSTSPASA